MQQNVLCFNNDICMPAAAPSLPRLPYTPPTIRPSYTSVCLQLLYCTILKPHCHLQCNTFMPASWTPPSPRVCLTSASCCALLSSVLGAAAAVSAAAACSSCSASACFMRLCCWISYVPKVLLQQKMQDRNTQGVICSAQDSRPPLQPAGMHVERACQHPLLQTLLHLRHGNS